MRRRWGRAFTMVELLVTMAVIALLLGLLLPTLRGVREHTGETSCASNLKQLGAATLAYLAAWDDHLPQVTGTDPFTGEQVVIGSLFGGKRGTLPYYDIEQYGADERPLTAYLGSGVHFSAPVVNGTYVGGDMPLVGGPRARGKLTHRYPESWRSKAPMIFRNTTQWFISMEKTGLRDKALKAIEETRFVPPSGQKRLRDMIETRPDWKIRLPAPTR